MSTSTEAPAAAAPPTLDPNALKRAAEEPGRNPGPWRHPGSHVPRFTSRTSRPAKQDGVGLKYGEYWVQGKRPSMEDAHSAALDAAKLLPASEPAKQDPDHHFAFFGIFDGHGGPRAAEFTAANLLPFMQEEKLKQTDTRTALERALHRVEEEWLKLARKADETDGTCVAVAVIDGKRLIAASIGDSEMVLSRNGRAFALCEVHNPSRNGDEAKRIEEAGGLLDKKRMRVIDPQNMHSLALSRTVGDLTYKTQETGVIAEPDIQEYELGESDAFLVIGCDGVWDVVEHQEAVDFCANLLRSGVRPPEVAKQLVEYAFAQGSTDNISACVVVLDHGAEPKDVAGAETA